MRYPVTLWACRRRNETRQTDGRYEATCSGARYVEVGAEPGPCGQLTVWSGNTETTCPAPMDAVGEYELEEERVEART